MTDPRSDGWAGSLVGKTLAGRYRLEEVMGVGGMGAVLRATQLALSRAVAVKILLPSCRDQVVMQRFQQEARAASAVSRRGVVEILDFDVDPDVGPFMVMEHLVGEALLERVKRGAMSFHASRDIIVSLIDTLTAVHAKGIVHRDLKPGNVFLHRDEETGDELVTILDFGISRVNDAIAEGQLTIPGTVLGTLRYMPPEQARGEPVDHRADLYSAGLMMYCCLTGLPPYASTPAGLLPAVVPTRSPGDIRSERAGLTGEIYAFVERAIASAPERRYQSARGMADALRALGDPQATLQNAVPITANVDLASLNDQPSPVAAAPPPDPNESGSNIPRTMAWKPDFSGHPSLSQPPAVAQYQPAPPVQIQSVPPPVTASSQPPPGPSHAPAIQSQPPPQLSQAELSPPPKRGKWGCVAIVIVLSIATGGGVAYMLTAQRELTNNIITGLMEEAEVDVSSDDEAQEQATPIEIETDPPIADVVTPVVPEPTPEPRGPVPATVLPPLPPPMQNHFFASSPGAPGEITGRLDAARARLEAGRTDEAQQAYLALTLRLQGTSDRLEAPDRAYLLSLARYGVGDAMYAELGPLSITGPDCVAAAMEMRRPVHDAYLLASTETPNQSGCLMFRHALVNERYAAMCPDASVQHVDSLVREAIGTYRRLDETTSCHAEAQGALTRLGAH